MRITMQGFLRARSLYPVSVYYLIVVVVSLGIARGWLTLGAGLGVLFVVAVLDVLLQMHREVVTVHGLVSSEHDELIAQNARLVVINDQLVSRVDRLLAEQLTWYPPSAPKEQ